MEFYGVRSGKISLEGLKISFPEFRNFFIDTYNYFSNRGNFKRAFDGYGNEPRLMKPSPEAFFFTHLGKNDIYPFELYGEDFDQVTVFTLIEILHEYIYESNSYGLAIQFEAQKEFRDEINKFLYHLDEGYLLTEDGYIIDLPEDGVKELISKNLPLKTSDTVTEQVETAIKMFFKYDSNMQEKKKAINILADVLEPYRQDLKGLTTRKHDKMIFDIVNNYGIRHNDIDQHEEFDKPVWYEWMFHYYLSTVHAVLRLKDEHYK